MVGLVLLALSTLPGDCQSTVWLDPADDLLEVTPAPLDLVEVSTTFLPTGFRIVLSFSPGTALADIDQLVAYVDIDADHDGATGTTTAIEAYGLPGPYPLMGVDYTVTMIAAAGWVDLHQAIDGELEWLGSHTCQRVGHHVIATIPYGQVAPDGISVRADHRLAVLAQNDFGFSDRAPNGNVAYSAVGSPADFDTDGDVDLDDLAQFISCSTGPAVPQLLPACAAADLDGDNDVDQDDFGVLQRAYTGQCVP